MRGVSTKVAEMRHDGIEAVAVKKKNLLTEQATKTFKSQEEDAQDPGKELHGLIYGVVHPPPPSFKPVKPHQHATSFGSFFLVCRVYVCFFGFLNNLLASPLP